MSWRDWGNTAIYSTQALVANPSTGTLIAEIDSTQLGAIRPGGQNFLVTWIVGCSTFATYNLEQCLSTGLDMSTAGRNLTQVFATVNQSGQYVFPLKLEPGDRLRVRVGGSTFTGSAIAKIIAEPLA